MKTFIIGMSAMFIIAMVGGAFAEGMSHDMSQMASTDGMNEMDHSGHSGELIHEGVVSGYRFSYHLTDISEKMAAMKAAGNAPEGMDATHHLMVYIVGPDGTPADGGQVGFVVEGPDGATQKLMCMEMGGGYGSDLKLAEGEEYSIKTKAVIGDEKLIDGFTYSIK